MMSKFITIALVGAGVLGTAAYGAAQAQTQVYGGSPAPSYSANETQNPAVNGGYARADNGGPATANSGAANAGSANPGTVNYVEGAILLQPNSCDIKSLWGGMIVVTRKDSAF